MLRTAERVQLPRLRQSRIDLDQPNAVGIKWHKPQPTRERFRFQKKCRRGTLGGDWHQTPWLLERGQHAVDRWDHVVFGPAE